MQENEELVSNFRKNGRQWRPKGDAEAVDVHGFIDPKLSRAEAAASQMS